MKAIKLNVFKPLNCEWKVFNKILFDMQYDTAKALNHCMTQWYLWQKDKESIKQATGKYPSAAELPSPEKRVYRELRTMFPAIYSKGISAIFRKSEQRWKTDTKDCFYKLEKSLPTFRKTHPVLVTEVQYNLRKEEDRYIVDVSFYAKTEKKGRTIFELQTLKLDNSKKAVLDRLVSGEYKKSQIQIGYNDRKRKWHVIFAYEPEKKEVALDPEKIVGVDLGIKYVFYAAIPGQYDRLFADGDCIKKFRDTIKYRKRAIQKDGKFSNRSGHGRKRMLNPFLKIGEAERRFRDTKYHQYTKQIIDFAVKKGAGTIQLENLDGLKAAKVGNFVLNDWAIADFHSKLEYKAEEYGIKVVYVNPRYTSQRCSRCGFIDSENREEQAVFKCLKCGFEENADRNAALNIAVKDIEELIKKEISRSDSGQKSQLLLEE